jgi:HPt (histidine-containing phosphotransfer) domain-containing protein
MTDSLDSQQHARTRGHGGAPVLDTTVLDDLVELGGDDGPEFLTEIVGLFFEDASTRVGAIRTGVQGREAEPIERAAHALKSSSANVGAFSFAELCKEVETLARSNDLDELARLLPRLVVMFDEVKEALRDFPSDSEPGSQEK